MILKKLYLSLLVFGNLLAMPAIVLGADIGFYKISKRGDLSELMLVYNADEAGCHSFSTRRKVHRISVIGYEYCSVFKESACDQDSILKAKWKGSTRHKRKKNPLPQLTQGSRWYLDPKTNVKIRSWFCKAKSTK